ncbi:Nucleotidyltransferase domain protein, partial [Haemophilus influenzae]
LFRQNIN